MSTSMAHDLTLNDPHAGQDRQQSQSPPDVYAARIAEIMSRPGVSEWAARMKQLKRKGK